MAINLQDTPIEVQTELTPARRARMILENANISCTFQHEDTTEDDMASYNYLPFIVTFSSDLSAFSDSALPYGVFVPEALIDFLKTSEGKEIAEKIYFSAEPEVPTFAILTNEY